ncbi:MAG: DnaB domain-containing protein helicase domain-containing protein [Limisphaerales bacterium]|nr:MAG: DnaB domain-containing protein helicase domain-containing protein [Limisphaerales bacterium]
MTALHESAQAAIAALKAGFQPVPVKPGEKRPQGSGWLDKSYTEAEIPAAFRPGCNLGLLLGEPSGWLVDVDLDAREAVAIASTFLPPTDMRHGRPGKPKSHAWYRSPGLKTTTFKSPDGTMLLELRSTGAQTVIPPSRHPSGEQHAFEASGDPATVPVDVLQRAAGKVAAAALLARSYPAAGSRQDFAMALAGFLLQGGLSEDDVITLIDAAARTAGDTEVGKRVAAGSDTARKVAAGTPVTGARALAGLIGESVVGKLTEWLRLQTARGPEPWGTPIDFNDYSPPAFPTRALPEYLRAWVEAESEATQTPADFAGVMALAVIATAAAKVVRVEVKPGWVEPVNIYTGVVAAPAERKSAVVAHASAPALDAQAELEQKMVSEIAAAGTRRSIAEKRHAKAIEAAAKAVGDDRQVLVVEAEDAALELSKAIVPVTPRLICDDVTPERIATLMAGNAGRLAIISAEGAAFELAAGRYNDKGPVLETLLKSHAGDHLSVERVNRPGENIRSPALTIGVAIQPDVLIGLASKPGFRGRGFLARFLFVVPTSMVGHRDVDAKPVPQYVEAAYTSRVKTLLLAPTRKGPDGEIQPRILPLTPSAVARMRVYQLELEPALRLEGRLGAIADWGGKLAGAVARIAGLLAVARDGLEVQAIDVDILEAAIELGRYFEAHALIAFETMGADPATEGAKRVLRWLKRCDKPAVTRREIHQALRSRFDRAAELDQPLAILEERGFIRSQVEPAPRGPGRPSPTFEVHPLLTKYSETSKHPGAPHIEDSEYFEPTNQSGP